MTTRNEDDVMWCSKSWSYWNEFAEQWTGDVIIIIIIIIIIIFIILFLVGFGFLFPSLFRIILGFLYLKTFSYFGG